MCVCIYILTSTKIYTYIYMIEPFYLLYFLLYIRRKHLCTCYTHIYVCYIKNYFQLSYLYSREYGELVAFQKAYSRS